MGRGHALSEFKIERQTLEKSFFCRGSFLFCYLIPIEHSIIKQKRVFIINLYESKELSRYTSKASAAPWFQQHK